MTHSKLLWQQATFLLQDNLEVKIGDLELLPDSLLVLIGGNGSGKTSVARAFNCELKLISGTAPDTLQPSLISFEQQIKLFEDDYNLRNSDATTAKEEKGITPRDLLESCQAPYLEELIASLKLEPLLDRPIRLLSGGEGRKVLLAKALAANPDLLIFDTPFDALDVQNRKALLELIEAIHIKYQVPTILIVNRPEEIPHSLTAMGIINTCTISKLSTLEELKRDEDAQNLLSYAQLPEVELPRPPSKFMQASTFTGPIVDIKDLSLTYERPIFDHLDFKIERGQHWQILGPNGAGKSTLLSFITGDNPLVYSRNVTVFGYKRGQGESIWEIKKNFGLVSGALHLDYRVSSTALNVVLSGFYDSIGLYNKPGDDELKVARQWLELIGLADQAGQAFKTLSFGKQRLLLIIRALVKAPPLLILDEPLQGLDGYSRALVRSYITYIMRHAKTSVIFVSHHQEDLPEGFTHRLQFIAHGDNFEIKQQKL